MGGFREHLDAGDAVNGLFRLELRFGEKFRGDFCVEVVVFREKHAAADEVLPSFFGRVCAWIVASEKALRDFVGRRY